VLTSYARRVLKINENRLDSPTVLIRTTAPPGVGDLWLCSSPLRQAAGRGREGNVERGGWKRKDRKGKRGIAKGVVLAPRKKIPEGTHALLYY